MAVETWSVAKAAEREDPIDRAISVLHTDPGALFEPEPLTELRALRSSDPARFARIRVAARKAGVHMAELDRLTIGAAKPASGDDAGMFPPVEPWPDAVDGCHLLDDIVSAMRRFVVADLPTLRAAALWVVHTWLIDALTVSPIANITAPEMRCGKTVLLSALGRLAYRPMQVANIAPAALFRSIEAWSPTLLIDEVDTFLRENEDARGIINSGFTRDSAFVVRCVGDDHKPTKFTTWGAKALCGIGKIAETLADRSIPLRLRRKSLEERAENLRRSDDAEWAELRSRIASFARDNAVRIADMRPDPIPGLSDRANDCWEPLLSIAETAGGTWPAIARVAASSLHDAEVPALTIGAQLLSDVRDAFGRRDRMSSVELLAALVADEENPWATWNKGRAMTVKQLAVRLSEYGIRSNTIRMGGTTAKGYRLEQFADAFARYIPIPTHAQSVTSSQSSNDAGFRDFGAVTSQSAVTDENARKVSNGAGCDDVTRHTAIGVEAPRASRGFNAGGGEAWAADL